jgi:predicted HNH restriction endonuclease
MPKHCKPSKPCKDCGNIYLVEEFPTDRGHSRNTCRACKTKAQRENNNLRMEKVINHLGGCCTDCGIKYNGTNRIIFDFHHVNPSEKHKSISDLRSGSLENMLKEAEKCILLCSNCHRILHEKERLS